MSTRDRVVIVGAAMAGLRTAEQLRSGGWDGAITVIGEEPHLPYNRPPLSKEALSLSADQPVGEWHDSVAFRLRASVADVDWQLGRRVVATDLTARTVKLDDGETLAWSGLVVASGLRPRRLPDDWPADGRFALRTLDDAIALRAALRPGARVVIVGAGFIGCEVAATAQRHGCEVTVVEPLEAPLVRGLGVRVGDAVRAYHERAGIRFRIGRSVTGLAADETGRLRGVRLDDGEEVPADVVLEAIGAAPNVEWLDGNGLDLSDGVHCDSDLRVEGRSGVVAVGDVARYPNARYPVGAQRVEHWSNPTDTAKRAAATLITDLTGDTPASEAFAPLPAFWSDQGELRLQSFGSTCIADDETVAEGSLETLDDGAVVDYTLDGELVGVLLINQHPKTYREHRARVDAAYLSTDGRNPR